MSEEAAENLRREPVEVECSACGETFEHAKRGAIPKRCPDCRDSRTAGKGPAGEGAPKRSRSIEQLEQNMRVQLAALASFAALADPWLGQHCLKNVPQAAKVHANLAASNPKIRAALERGTEMAGWGPVIVFWAMFAVPVVAHYRNAGAPTPPPAAEGPENVRPFVRPSHAV